MTTRCARWKELSDRKLLGEPISARDCEYLRAHEFDCAQCAREAAFFRELRPAPLHLVPSEDEVQRILQLHEAALAEEVTRRATPIVGDAGRRRQAWFAVAGAVALAASVLLSLARSPADSNRTRAALVAAAPVRSSAMQSPAVAASALSVRAKEDSCGTVADGIVVCLTAGSEIGQLQLDGPHRTVELKRGRALASLEPQPKGWSFSIKTSAGTVTAVGTIFSVEIDATQTAYARVTRGKVLVHSHVQGADQALLAGQQVRLGEASASALPAIEAERDLDLVDRWGIVAGATAAEVASDGKANGANEELPASSPGAFQDELAHARKLRGRGQYAAAAAIYRSIHASSPRSVGGRVALVSLGSLQLSSLGDPRGALASYERYLAGGEGPLRQQAEYGRIRALRALGRSVEALAGVRAFVARYPNAPETRQLTAEQRASNNGP